MGPLMKAKALKKDGPNIVRAAATFPDETKGLLEQVKAGGGAGDAVPEDVAKALRKRQLVSQVGCGGCGWGGCWGCGWVEAGRVDDIDGVAPSEVLEQPSYKPTTNTPRYNTPPPKPTKKRC